MRINFTENKQRPIHRWAPWVAGFSWRFVEETLRRHLPPGGVVLDSFAGVGATLVEAARLGRRGVGFELNPYAAFACRVKLSAPKVNPARLRAHIERFAAGDIPSDISAEDAPPSGFRTRTPFYGPNILPKVLAFRRFTRSIDDPEVRDVFRLAFAATMTIYSNYSYEPSLGTRRGAGKPEPEDFPVHQTLTEKLRAMADDVENIQRGDVSPTTPVVFNESFFDCRRRLPPNSIDLCITSPPYLNNYHYVRNTRPQLFWLGFVSEPKQLKPLQEANFGRDWQTVRGLATLPLNFPNPPQALQEQIARLRALHPERGVYGGNGWANYVACYFNDCRRWLEMLWFLLKPGGQVFAVLGNSIIQGVFIPTERYVAEIAATLGFEVADVSPTPNKRIGDSIKASSVRVGTPSGNAALTESVVRLRKPAGAAPT